MLLPTVYANPVASFIYAVLPNWQHFWTVDALSVQGLIRAVAIIVLLVTGPFAFMFLKRRLVSRDVNEQKVNS